MLIDGFFTALLARGFRYAQRKRRRFPCNSRVRANRLQHQKKDRHIAYPQNNIVKMAQKTENKVFFAEGKYIIAYCPALDLSVAGKDEEEAKREFAQMFVEYATYFTGFCKY